jgi:hypothetical protein
MLLTSNYYSVLHYDSEVWLIHSLSISIKKLLLSTSSNALKVAFNYRFQFINYIELHKMAGRANPSMLTNYKLALLLYNIHNSVNQSDEWVHLNLNPATTSRQTCFHVIRNNRIIIGLNAITSRLMFLNDKIPLELLNIGYDSYKVECKRLFLN